jgi:uncharacterized repeat protein (TIGR03803 family)
MLSNAVPSRWRRAINLLFLLLLFIPLLSRDRANAQTFTVLHSFTGPTRDGGGPMSIARDASGTLYGTTCMGGVSYGGMAFSLSDAGKETVLYNFRAGYGVCPDSLVPWNGSVYGATADGGTYRGGAIFRLDNKNSEVVLYSFQGGHQQGAGPTLSFADANGTFYGTDIFGGSYGYGTVFKVNTSGMEKDLYSFGTGPDGSLPNPGLARDEQGNLYGTTTSGGDSNCGINFGCGTVFKLDTTGMLTTLYTFTGGLDGGAPYGGLIRDDDGNLYGTTGNGGNLGCSDGCGTVFKLDPSGNETVLYRFSGPPDGESPAGNLVRDESGNLYGITSYGGDANCLAPAGCGIVFKLDTAGKETVLHRFTYSPDGALPVQLIRDPAGNLYGATNSGGELLCYPVYGPRGCGTLFKLAP